MYSYKSGPIFPEHVSFHRNETGSKLNQLRRVFAVLLQIHREVLGHERAVFSRGTLDLSGTCFFIGMKRAQNVIYCAPFLPCFCFRYIERYSDKSELIFPSALMLHPPSAVTIVGENVTWHCPTTLEDMACLKADHPEGRIVAGNTEACTALL